jgi:hypothetical protein
MPWTTGSPKPRIGPGGFVEKTARTHAPPLPPPSRSRCRTRTDVRTIRGLVVCNLLQTSNACSYRPRSALAGSRLPSQRLPSVRQKIQQRLIELRSIREHCRRGAVALDGDLDVFKNRGLS